MIYRYRTIRCEHGFAERFCLEEGCPHQEAPPKDNRTIRRVERPHYCKTTGCGAFATVRHEDKRRNPYYLCRSCDERRNERKATAAE